MRRRLLAPILLVALAVPSALAQAQGPWTSAAIARCIRDPACRPSFVVAHRAIGFGLPEDSRAAVDAAIRTGVPVIEVDLRRSADGRLVVLHDPDLRRTTSIKGKVKDFTLAELKRALLTNDEPLPTFEEIYAVARGRAVLDLRFHVDVIEQAADWIAANGSFDDVIFFAISDDLARAAARVRARYPAMIVMAKAQRWADAERMAALFGRPPEILHPDVIDPELDRTLREHGFKVFRNLLDPDTAPAEALANGPEFLAGRLDFLQTNRPALYLAKLRERREADQARR